LNPKGCYDGPVTELQTPSASSERVVGDEL
jgi:hypothetical protein